LSGDGLGELVDILAKAFEETDHVKDALHRIHIPISEVQQSSITAHYWRHAILAADLRDKLDDLLRNVDKQLKELKIYPEFKAWNARAGRHVEVQTAVRHIEAGLLGIESHIDPRDARDSALTLRLAIFDLRRAFEDKAIHASLLAIDDTAASEASSKICRACGQALKPTKSLLRGIQRANTLLESRRDSDGDDMVFIRDQRILRALTDDQDDVYERTQQLLEVLRLHAPALFSMTLTPDAD
jgi:hypothetical protein